MLMERFHAIRRLEPFSRARSHSLIWRCPREHSPFWIFTRNHFQYYLFGLLMLLVWFRAILRLKLFWHARSRSLISRCSWQHFFLNFRTRSLPKLFIWPIDTTGAILSNSETVTSLVCTVVLVNLRLHPGDILFEILPEIASNIIYLTYWCYWCDFEQFWDCNFFCVCARAR